MTPESFLLSCLIAVIGGMWAQFNHQLDRIENKIAQLPCMQPRAEKCEGRRTHAQ